ncbi:MAG: molybdenum cofactor guanylyltransferase [Clostridiaceae bacterium]
MEDLSLKSKRDKLDKFKTAVILAGGKSSRMGFDKQLLKLSQFRVIDILAEKLKEEFEEIIIVTNKPELYKDSAYKIVTDEIKEKGPLEGIYIGLKAASSEYVYFTACDMPNINIEYIRYMKKKLLETSVQGCVTKINDRVEPFNSFYSKELVNKVEDFLLQDKRALVTFINSIKTFFIDKEIFKICSFSDDMFLNLNTVDEFENFKSNSEISSKPSK